MPSRDFLERRNALWRRLRSLPPETPAFGETLAELSVLTRWSRAQVLAGLGLTEGEVTPPEEERS